MKPAECASRLRLIAQAVSKDKSLPPAIRSWFGLAVMKRLSDPDTYLDNLLGLRSRSAGRSSLYSRVPARDAELRLLVSRLGLPTASAGADEILRLSKAGRLAEVAKIYRIPGRRQLIRILSCDS